MELQESKAFVEKCFHDESASCACVCPFHLDIRSFLKKMARGRWPAAYRDLSTAILFPSVAAELCPQPCRERCQRSSLGDEALNIAALEKACIHFASAESSGDFHLPPKSESVAIVGAGPAGLACAIGLARKKYAVTVFEKEQGWGGHLRSHPRFSFFDADFNKQFSTQNVNFRYGIEADETMLGSFTAVYVATGENGCDFGLSESWNCNDYTCSRNGWFLGGGVVGMPLMESIACGSKLSQLIEAYLQTGKARMIVEASGEICDGHMMEHPDEISRPIILPADPVAGYTKDEAKAEAARCMQCVCDKCMSDCELLAQYRKSPFKLAADICGDSHTTPPFSNCEATRQTYSCNMCSRCAELCPENVDMGKLFRFSREDRWKQGKWIPGMHDYWLRELDFNGSEAFYASPGKHDFMFFPGCQLSASMPNHVLSAWAFLCSRFDAGIVLGCCGAPAVWAGDLDRRQRNTELLCRQWECMGKPVIICACTSCSEMLKELLPEAKTTSLYTLLAENNSPNAETLFGSAAVFDPCSASHNSEVQYAVRKLAEKNGCNIHELNDSGRCCGYGGHMRLADPKLYEKIADKRSNQSSLPYLVYCANCYEVFRSRGKPCAHILDAVFGSRPGSIPTLSEKRANLLALKGKLMQEIENICFIPSSREWDTFSLKICPSAQQNMEDKLITESDIRELIFKAEADKDYFEDASGLRSSCLAKDVLTFWADWRCDDSGLIILESAYCHRMHIGEDGQ